MYVCSIRGRDTAIVNIFNHRYQARVIYEWQTPHMQLIMRSRSILAFLASTVKPDLSGLCRVLGVDTTANRELLDESLGFYYRCGCLALVLMRDYTLMRDYGNDRNDIVLTFIRALITLDKEELCMRLLKRLVETI